MNRIGAQHCTRATAEVCAAREADGRKLRSERESAGMTRREAAAALGVSVDVLRRWEAGLAPIPAPRRAQWAAIIAARGTVAA